MIRQRGAFGDVPFEASTPANPHPFGPGPSPNASTLGASAGRQSGETNSFERHAPVLPAIYPAEPHVTVHEEHGELIAVPEDQANTTGDEYIKVRFAPYPGLHSSLFASLHTHHAPLPLSPTKIDAGGPYVRELGFSADLSSLGPDRSQIRSTRQCSRTATLTFLSSSWNCAMQSFPPIHLKRGYVAGESAALKVLGGAPPPQTAGTELSAADAAAVSLRWLT